MTKKKINQVVNVREEFENLMKDAHLIYGKNKRKFEIIIQATLDYAFLAGRESYDDEMNDVLVATKEELDDLLSRMDAIGRTLGEINKKILDRTTRIKFVEMSL